MGGGGRSWAGHSHQQLPEPSGHHCFSLSVLPASGSASSSGAGAGLCGLAGALRPCVQGRPVGSLQLALKGIFTPRKSTNATNRRLSPFFFFFQLERRDTSTDRLPARSGSLRGGSGGHVLLGVCPEDGEGENLAPPTTEPGQLFSLAEHRNLGECHDPTGGVSSDPALELESGQLP